MKLKTKVVVTQPIHEKGMKLLVDSVEEVVVAKDSNIETIAGLLDEKAEGVIVRYNPFPRELIEKAPNLKVIARHGIGTELIDLEAATEHNIAVVNTPNAATVSVAEHAVTLMLCLAKNIFYADSELRKGNYAVKDKYLSYELEGKTVGIVGLGKIGMEVAKKCKYGFGMKVIGYDPYVNKEKAQEIGVELFNNIDEVLESSDFVSLHLPLTESTKHIINEEKLRKMKKSAYLINCARGAIVDEKALIKALQEGSIAGAGLDVFEKEPPELDNPLFKMNNVIVTPHSSSLTEDGKIKMAVYAVEGLLQVLKGEKPTYLVNTDLYKK
ncbi:MAG: D-3-phosphoglycerate dehydrogenase / 2-oxoglutarate reductase [Thermoanaerobacteraceae bacterium]|nr:D-3-phosphoglycerate dehydrogenase / 2-oxoglutarate reductase [Thermoanaerobacteraceae bacterium]